MKETLLLRFLYRTILGRMALKLLVRPGISKAAGYYLSSGASKWLVSYYIRKYRIDMRDIAIPQGGFSSFNDFFTRKRSMECFDMSCGHLISPCDGYLSLAKIRDNTVFHIKNACFTLDDLLQDHELAGQFREGSALIFRLTPAEYHRYCYVENGRMLLHRKIPGRLHCVRPVAIRSVPVFAQNSREYQVFQTESFGTMVQMEIGALLVGRIRNDKSSSEYTYVRKGDEKGYFEFGGSTIVILLEKNAACWNAKLYGRLNSDGEIPVRMGDFVAESRERRSG